MPEPMTPEQRAEIREAAQPKHADILAQLIKHGAHDDPKHGKVIVHGVTIVPAAALKAAVRTVWGGVPALLAEVERLRAELATAREQVERVRIYAREGCLCSKSTIYNRVGRDLLRIVGDGTVRDA